jgi:hypothetical protein
MMERVRLLHNIGVVDSTNPSVQSNYNSPVEVSSCLDQLTFDGVYFNVYEHRHLLLRRKHPTIIFVMGNFIGLDNNFDKGMPLERYCDWNQILELVTDFNCELGWHTWAHKDLCKLDDQEVLREITPPIKMDYLAYPYGNVDKRVERIVEDSGLFNEAFSVTQGNDTQFQRRRYYL